MPDLVGTVGIVGRGSRAKGLAASCLAAGWQVRASPDDAGVAVGAQVVIELVPDDPALKDRVFRELDAVAAADTVLATGTVWPSVEARARMTRRPERVIGLHFVEAWPASSLAEVAVTERTSQAALEATGAFVSSLGRTAVLCADAPGFIVGRVGRAYLLEAVRMVEAGQGSVSGIDAALEAAGYACGPLRLLDRMGLDSELAMTAALFEALDEAPRLRPPDLLRDLVDEGRLGRAQGRGFYRYAADGSALADVAFEGAARLSDQDIVERLELAVINEAYRAVEERMASPADVDLAMRLGAGDPRGPFERVSELGLRHVVEHLQQLHAATRESSGDQYAVASLLWQMATV